MPSVHFHSLASSLSMLAVLLGIAAVNAPDARAYGSLYCDQLVITDSWCNRNAALTKVTYNSSDYIGSGTIRVGIKQVFTNGSYINRKFADNHVATKSGCHHTTPWAANASTGTYFIRGYWEWADPCIAARRVKVPSGARRASRSRATPAVASTLAVLRMRLTSRDVLPPDLSRAPAAQAYDWATRGARLARVTWGGERYYVIPGKRLCLYRTETDGYTGTCNRWSSIADGRLLMTEDIGGNRLRASGIVPDGVSQVGLRMPGELLEWVGVQNNTFVVETVGDAEAEPRELLFRMGSEVERVRRD